MLYVTHKWSKSGGMTGNCNKKRKVIGHVASFVFNGSQSNLAIWKTKFFPEQYNAHQWFQILVYDNLSNIAENSPRSNKRLRAAHARCWQMKPPIAWRQRSWS